MNTDQTATQEQLNAISESAALRMRYLRWLVMQLRGEGGKAYVLTAAAELELLIDHFTPEQK